MQFDAGAAAYKMRDYDKATQAFSQALLTQDKRLQENSHFNMGRTLEERADMAKTDEDAVKDLENAKTHYEDVLKLDPGNQAATGEPGRSQKEDRTVKATSKTKAAAAAAIPAEEKSKRPGQGIGRRSGQPTATATEFVQAKSTAAKPAAEFAKSKSVRATGRSRRTSRGNRKAKTNPRKISRETGESPSLAIPAARSQAGNGNKDQHPKAALRKTGERNRPLLRERARRGSPSPGSGSAGAKTVAGARPVTRKNSQARSKAQRRSIAKTEGSPPHGAGGTGKGRRNDRATGGSPAAIDEG